jgi:hypothetical protein
MVIPRRKRSSLERYLQHPNERVRAYIERAFALDAQRRAEFRAEQELFEASVSDDDFGDDLSVDAALGPGAEGDIPF